MLTRIKGSMLDPAAVSDRLGYTPVNKAGDTINGSLVVAGTAQITGNSGVPAQAGGDAIHTGGYGSPVSGKLLIGDGTGWKYSLAKRTGGVTTDLITFMDNGTVLSPNQPAFYAFQGAAGTTATGPIAFTSTRINIGNCYNTSNGRFTAPVSGNYILFLHILHRGNGTTGNMEPTFYKNGSNINSRGMAYSVASQATGHIPVQTMAIIPLVVGDYVQAGASVVTGGSDIYLADNLSHFSGYLLG